MSKENDNNKSYEFKGIFDEKILLGIGIDKIDFISEKILTAIAAVDLTVKIVDAIKAMPKDEETVAILKAINTLYRSRSGLYNYLHLAEMQYGRDSAEFINTLEKIGNKHDEIVSKLAPLREDPGKTITNTAAAKFSEKDFSIAKMVAFDLATHDKKGTIHEIVFPTSVFSMLYLRSLVTVIDEETDKGIDESFKSDLIDIKNGYLMDNPEVESWYLKRGFFGEGKMLNIDEDPEPEIMAYMGLPKEKYGEYKEMILSSFCDNLLKEYEEARKADDFFQEYFATIKIGAMFRFIDNDKINSMVDTVRKTSHQTSRNPKILEKFAKREVRRRQEG